MTRTAGGLLRAAVLCLAAATLAGCVEQQAVGPRFDPASAPKGTYLKVGEALLAAREPDKAFDAFVTSMRVDGITPEALVGAGIAQERQGLLTSSARYLQRAVDMEPNSVTANNNLGVVLFKLKEYYRARDAFRTAYAVSSGRSAIAERNLNRAQAIVAELEQAGQKDPEASHRVVRLGTSEFLITPVTKAPAEMIGPE